MFAHSSPLILEKSTILNTKCHFEGFSKSYSHDSEHFEIYKIVSMIFML